MIRTARLHEYDHAKMRLMKEEYSACFALERKFNIMEPMDFTTMCQHPHTILLVAYDGEHGGEEAIGMCLLEYATQNSEWCRSADYPGGIMIWGLCTHRRYRGRRVAAALIEAAQRDARTATYLCIRTAAPDANVHVTAHDGRAMTANHDRLVDTYARYGYNVEEPRDVRSTCMRRGSKITDRMQVRDI